MYGLALVFAIAVGHRLWARAATFAAADTVWGAALVTEVA
jgi:hypothetical protein